MEGVDPVFRLSRAGARGRVYPLQFAPQQVAHLVGLGVVVRDTLVPLLEVVLVVAAVNVHRPVVQFHHYVAHAVEEVAVVGNHQQGAAAALEVAF